MSRSRYCSLSSSKNSTQVTTPCQIYKSFPSRSKEHNATFLTHVKAKSKELAIELEDKLGELGFDNGDRPGNGAEDDTVYVYIYKKTKDTKEHLTD